MVTLPEKGPAFQPHCVPDRGQPSFCTHNLFGQEQNQIRGITRDLRASQLRRLPEPAILLMPSTLHPVLHHYDTNNSPTYFSRS